MRTRHIHKCKISFFYRAQWPSILFPVCVSNKLTVSRSPRFVCRTAFRRAEHDHLSTSTRPGHQDRFIRIFFLLFITFSVLRSTCVCVADRVRSWPRGSRQRTALLIRRSSVVVSRWFTAVSKRLRRHEINCTKSI